MVATYLTHKRLFLQILIYDFIQIEKQNAYTYNCKYYIQYLYYKYYITYIQFKHNLDNNHVHRFTIIAIVMLKNLLHPTDQIHERAQR